jgi:hypothetical protein
MPFRPFAESEKWSRAKPRLRFFKTRSGNLGGSEAIEIGRYRTWSDAALSFNKEKGKFQCP